jgi:hypothetical protein
MNRILATSLAALFAATSFAEEKTTTNSSNVNVTTNKDGKAVVTIEVNGKKEVRVIDLKNPQTSNFSIATSSSSSSPAQPSTWLGVSSDELSEEMAAQLPVTPGTGVIVRHVAENSPAAKAGVQKHDVLTKLDDQIITDSRQLQKLVRTKKAGDAAELTLLRKGQEMKLKATLEETTELVNQTDFNLPILDIGAGKVALQDIIKKYTDAVGAAGARGSVIITSPDGKVVTNLDTGDIKVAPLLRKADQALRDTNISSEVLKKLEEAIAEIRTNAQRAGEEAARAMKQAEEAARRATEAARRAEEKLERDREQAAPEKKAPKGE